MDEVGRPWTVVVLGKWNKAILTPQGIANRLLEVPENAPIEVDIAINIVAPYRVKNQGLVVMVDEDKLIVEAPVGDYEALERAMRVASKAVLNLPETPFAAAGINVHLPADRLDPAILECTPWDHRLECMSDAVIEARAARVIRWKGGRAMVSVQRVEEKHPVVHVNLERRSALMAELRDWLTMPIKDVQEKIELLTRTIQTDKSDEHNDI